MAAHAHVGISPCCSNKMALATMMSKMVLTTLVITMTGTVSLLDFILYHLGAYSCYDHRSSLFAICQSCCSAIRGGVCRLVM